MRKAFEDAIAGLGESAKQSMIYELTVQAGLNFVGESLTVEKLHEGLATLYWKETADILIEEVLLKMDRAASPHWTGNNAQGLIAYSANNILKKKWSTECMWQ